MHYYHPSAHCRYPQARTPDPYRTGHRSRRHQRHSLYADLERCRQDQYPYRHTDGVVSKKSYYTSTGSAALKLSAYFVYTVADSNITDIKAYTATNIMLADATLTYGTEKNPFHHLCLFNYASRLNMEPLQILSTTSSDSWE